MNRGRLPLAFFITLIFFSCVQAVAAEQAQVASAVAYFTPGDQATSAIVEKIKSSTKSIFVQAYSFTSVPIAKALADAAQRNIYVAVLLDKSNESAKYGASDFIAGRVAEVWCDDKVAIAHSKVMIIDDHIVITGSFNFSVAAESKNSENLLILDSTDLAKSYRKNWDGRKALSRPFVRKADRPAADDK